VASDAAELWSLYREEIVRHEYDKPGGYVDGSNPIGLLAPWCADELRLGRETACRRTLGEALAHGYLANWRAKDADGLIAQLHAWGYGRR
jgi:hypothetical protein